MTYLYLFTAIACVFFILMILFSKSNYGYYGLDEKVYDIKRIKKFDLVLLLIILAMCVIWHLTKWSDTLFIVLLLVVVAVELFLRRRVCKKER